MNTSNLEWIVNATYEDLLRRQRFAPVGDPLFADAEAYEVFKEKMRRMREADPAMHVRVSKEIGW